MEFSSDKMKQVFLSARKLVVTPAKGGKNTFLKNEYSTIRDINNAIRHANNEVGITFIQEPIFDTANTHPNIMLMKTTLMYEERVPSSDDESGDSDVFVYHQATSIMPVPIGQMDAQGFGSTFTYACRYALQGIYNLNGADDDGNGATITVEKTIDMWKKDISEAATSEDLSAITNALKGKKDKGLVKALQSHLTDRKRQINMANAKSFNPAAPANAVVNEPSVKKTDIAEGNADDEEF